MTLQEQQQLVEVLVDAVSIIEAQDDPDCEAWLGQAKAVLGSPGVKAVLASSGVNYEGLE